MSGFVPYHPIESRSPLEQRVQELQERVVFLEAQALRHGQQLRHMEEEITALRARQEELTELAKLAEIVLDAEIAAKLEGGQWRD